MGTISLQTPAIGQPFSTEAPKVDSNFVTLQTWANGNVDAVNLSAALAQLAGVNQSGQVVSGSSIIATSESRTNTAYGTLATPDQVTNVVLSANGLISVWYQATWQESVVGAAKAAIFLGANQIKIQSGSGPVIQETATGNGSGAVNLLLATGTFGLASSTSNNYSGDATTGQIVGSQTGANVVSAGPSCLFAAAGTYTVSVQFKASSGSVTASNRKLWVQALSFV